MSRGSSKEKEDARRPKQHDKQTSSSESPRRSKNSASPERPRRDRHPADERQSARREQPDRHPRREERRGSHSPSEDPGNEGRTVYISQLNRKAREKHLEEAFGRFGEFVSVKVVKDLVTGESRGYGFIEFKLADSAQQAIAGMNGVDFMELKLRVEISRRQRPRRNTPGEYLGKRPGPEEYPYDRHRHARQPEPYAPEGGYQRRPREFADYNDRPREHDRRPPRYLPDRDRDRDYPRDRDRDRERDRDYPRDRDRDHDRRRSDDYGPRRPHYSNSDPQASRDRYPSRGPYEDRRGPERVRSYNEYPRPPPPPPAPAHYREKPPQAERPRYKKSASASPKSSHSYK